MLASAAYRAAPQRANYAATASSIAHPVPHIASWPAVSEQLVKTIESIWFQGSDVGSALKSGDQQIDGVFAK